MAAPDDLSRLQLYDISKKLGAGKFSVVYTAKRKTDDYPVAIKQLTIMDIMDPDDREAYINEIEILQTLDHPNIIQYLDSFVENGELYIVMELAELGDLARLINRARDRDQPLGERTIWKLFYQIAAGVQHMHDARIMHRDIKPANIFVGSKGKVKLGDLGLGRVFSSGTTAALSLVGTPYYMAPERMRELPYNFASDIWSLGCLLYEMAALKNPFYAEDLDLVTLFQKITSVDYDPIPEGEYEAVAALVEQMIVVDPDDRLSIQEVYAYAKDQVKRFASRSSHD